MFSQKRNEPSQGDQSAEENERRPHTNDERLAADEPDGTEGVTRTVTVSRQESHHVLLGNIKRIKQSA